MLAAQVGAAISLPVLAAVARAVLMALVRVAAPRPSVLALLVDMVPMAARLRLNLVPLMVAQVVMVAAALAVALVV